MYNIEKTIKVIEVPIFRLQKEEPILETKPEIKPEEIKEPEIKPEEPKNEIQDLIDKIKTNLS